LLGVSFQSNCKMDMHIQNLLSQCTQRLSLIKLLKHQGMPQLQLSVVTYPVLHYCWGGFLSVGLKNRIGSFLKRLKRFGDINCTITINDLSDRSDYELFKKVCCTSHSLHHLLPRIVLFARGHPFH